MGKGFIFTLVCLFLTLVLAGTIIWTSYENGQEALYESENLGVNTAEIRGNANVGKVPLVDPESDPDLPVDYTKLTPSLQKFLREGKLNPEIEVDRVR